MKLPSTAIFWEGVKGKQRPFGLQLCVSHGRTFTWHFRCGVIDGENAPNSPFASVYVCDIRDLRHGSRFSGPFNPLCCHSHLCVWETNIMVSQVPRNQNKATTKFSVRNVIQFFFCSTASFSKIFCVYFYKLATRILVYTMEQLLSTCYLWQT